MDGPAYLLGSTGLGPVITLASIQDGTSNTAIFSEWVKGTGTNKAGLGQIYLSGVSWSTTTPSPKLIGSLGQSLQTVSATCQSATTFLTSPPGYDKGYSYMEHTNGLGGGYSHLNTPNKKACWFSTDSAVYPSDRSLVGRQLVPLRRCERRLPRRLGPLHQGQRQLPDLGCTRHHVGRRSHRRQQLLIGSAKESGWAEPSRVDFRGSRRGGVDIIPKKSLRSSW